MKLKIDVAIDALVGGYRPGYTRGRYSIGINLGMPHEDAIPWLEEMVRHFVVAIHKSPYAVEGIKDIEGFLMVHGLPMEAHSKIEFCEKTMGDYLKIEGKSVKFCGSLPSVNEALDIAHGISE